MEEIVDMKKKMAAEGTLKQNIFDYIRKKYKVSPEYPWKKPPSGAVLRHEDNRKWFALVMEVPSERVGLPPGKVLDVVNLKIDDLFLRDMVIREEGILPAYHMNKLHWITVFLDGSVPEERIYELIDLSFTATASAKKKAPG